MTVLGRKRRAHLGGVGRGTITTGVVYHYQSHILLPSNLGYVGVLFGDLPLYVYNFKCLLLFVILRGISINALQVI